MSRTPPVETRDPDPSDPPPEREAAPTGVRCWSSEQLLGPGREAWITHDGKTYRLLLTRNRKLILVK